MNAAKPTPRRSPRLGFPFVYDTLLDDAECTSSRVGPRFQAAVPTIREWAHQLQQREGEERSPPSLLSLPCVVAGTRPFAPAPSSAYAQRAHGNRGNEYESEVYSETVSGRNPVRRDE